MGIIISNYIIKYAMSFSAEKSKFFIYLNGKIQIV